jgi:hypothetical protein
MNSKKTVVPLLLAFGLLLSLGCASIRQDIGELIEHEQKNVELAKAYAIQCLEYSDFTATFIKEGWGEILPGSMTNVLAQIVEISNKPMENEDIKQGLLLGKWVRFWRYVVDNIPNLIPKIMTYAKAFVF